MTGACAVALRRHACRSAARGRCCGCCAWEPCFAPCFAPQRVVLTHALRTLRSDSDSIPKLVSDADVSSDSDLDMAGLVLSAPEQEQEPNLRQHLLSRRAHAKGSAPGLTQPAGAGATGAPRLVRVRFSAEDDERLRGCAARCAGVFASGTARDAGGFFRALTPRAPSQARCAVGKRLAGHRQSYAAAWSHCQAGALATSQRRASPAGAHARGCPFPQCRDRYNNYAHPDLNMAPPEPAEVLRFAELYKQHGHKWTEIANAMSAAAAVGAAAGAKTRRSENWVKSAFFSNQSRLHCTAMLAELGQ